MKYERLFREMDAEIARCLKLLTKEELTIVLFWLILDSTTTLGILFAFIKFYQPLLRDLVSCDIRDPFNLQEGWLLWAIIGVIVVNTAKFGTKFATKYFSKRWPQPKTKDSVDTRRVVDQLTGSREVSILMWLVMVALLLLPVVEEYVYRGYLMASLTKWLATTFVVVISSCVCAFVFSNPEPFSELFVGVLLAFVLTFVKTGTLVTLMAMHLLLVMIECFIAFITFMRWFVTFMRRSFSQGIVLLHQAKEVSYRARSHRARGHRARGYRARGYRARRYRARRCRVRTVRVASEGQLLALLAILSFYWLRKLILKTAPPPCVRVRLLHTSLNDGNTKIQVYLCRKY